MAESIQQPDDQSPQEHGFPFAPGVAMESLPPGMGGNLYPHFRSFSAIVNAVNRSYRYTHDEALRNSTSHALAMAREPIIWEAIRSRQYPTVQFPWHLEPDNPKDTTELDCVVKATKIIESIPRFQQYKRQLLDAIWFGRSAVQESLRWDWSRGYKAITVGQWWPVNGDKLVYRFSGQVGVLVNALYDGKTWLSERGRVHYLDPLEREQFVVHEFEPTDEDFTMPELAGAVHGTGVRGKLYWLWWIRSQVMAWLLDYLERIGAGGLTIYYYQAGNQANKDEVEAAAKAQVGAHTLLFPRFFVKETAGSGIERIEPSNAGAQLLLTLVTEYFDSVMRRLITGPYLSSEVEPSGLGFGGGSADLLAGPFARIVRYDAVDLEHTITTDLVAIIYKYSFPGVKAPRFLFDIDNANAAEVMEAAKDFYEMGGEVDAEHLRDILGLPMPEEGHAILAQPQPMMAQGVGPGPVPEGVPFQGQPGPAQMSRDAMAKLVAAANDKSSPVYTMVRMSRAYAMAVRKFSRRGKARRR